jgi:hypothetical protein
MLSVRQLPKEPGDSTLFHRYLVFGGTQCEAQRRIDEIHPAPTTNRVSVARCKTTKGCWRVFVWIKPEHHFD